jgi:transcription antitermination factor NusG
MIQKESKPNWYAVYVRSRTEKKVLASLTEIGIEAYVPLQRKLRQWSDRKKWVEIPLISGYVFVNITKREYEMVLKNDYVVCYVFFEGKAAVIRNEDIDLLKRMLGQKEYELEATTENFKPGQMVEIMTGPLCGTVGELIEFRGKNRVALRIPPLGYTVLVEGADKIIAPYLSN